MPPCWKNGSFAKDVTVFLIVCLLGKNMNTFMTTFFSFFFSEKLKLCHSLIFIFTFARTFILLELLEIHCFWYSFLFCWKCWQIDFWNILFKFCFGAPLVNQRERWLVLKSWTLCSLKCSLYPSLQHGFVGPWY